MSFQDFRVDTDEAGIDPSLIRRNLQLILESPEFSNSKRLRTFLSYVVEHSLSSNGRLKGYKIAIDAFRRPTDFDPNDPYIRNIARDVRKALSSYYERNATELKLGIEIPKGSYLPRYHLLRDSSDFSAAARNWADLSSQGRVEINGLDRNGQILTNTDYPSSTLNEHSGRTGSLSGGRIPLSSEVSPIRLRPTIAIIPLQCQNHSAEFENVGEIIADSVITNLSKSPTLDVISRLTTTKFSAGPPAMQDIRDRLNADYVLSGTYIVGKQSIRLNVEIAETRNACVIWADKLIVDKHELYESCDNIADGIFEVLCNTILEEQIRHSRYQPLESLELHTLLISAIELMHRASTNDFKKANELLDMLKRKCSTHSLPYTYLAQWHVMATNREAGWSSYRTQNGEKAIEYCEKALSLDPEDSLACTIRGLIATNFEKQPDNGLELYSQAINTSPSNALAHCLRAALYGFMEEGELAVSDAERSMRLSPLDPQLYLFRTSAAAASMALGDYLKAEEHALKSYALNSKHTSNLRALIAIQVELGKIEDAQSYAKKLMRIDPDFTTESYRKNAANSIYKIGSKISASLKLAGIP